MAVRYGFKKRYFGGRANIFAVIVNPECQKFENENFPDSSISQWPLPGILIDDDG